MRSFFVGAGLFIAFVALAPFTMMYIFGEQYQGRRRQFWNTSHGVALGVITFMWCMLALILVGVSR